MRDVYVIAVHSIKFGKYLDRSIKDLAAQTVLPCLKEAGLESRGHPIGASGLAQIHELVTQLRGNAGPRQVKGACIARWRKTGAALLARRTRPCASTYWRRRHGNRRQYMCIC